MVLLSMLQADSRARKANAYSKPSRGYNPVDLQLEHHTPPEAVSNSERGRDKAKMNEKAQFTRQSAAVRPRILSSFLTPSRQAQQF